VVRPWALLGLVAAAAVVKPVRLMAGDASGRALIPVLRDTGLAMLLWAALTALALAL
jgi:1,4-dihydroxy-2-naphthoate octaprenyltransferase